MTKPIRTDQIAGTEISQSPQYAFASDLRSSYFSYTYPPTNPPNSISLAPYIDLIMDPGVRWPHVSDGRPNISADKCHVARVNFDVPALGATSESPVVQIWGNYDVRYHVTKVVDRFFHTLGLVARYVLEGNTPLPIEQK